MNKRHQVYAGEGGNGAVGQLGFFWGFLFGFFVFWGLFVIISIASLESEVSPQHLFFPFLFKTSHQETLWFWPIQRY